MNGGGRRPRRLEPRCGGPFVLAPAVKQDPIDDVGPLDAGNDSDRTTTVLTDLDVDPEHTPETFRPGHGAMLFGFGRDRLAGRSLAAPRRCDLRTKSAVGCKHAMKASEVNTGPWYQRRQPGDKIQNSSHSTYSHRTAVMTLI